MEFTNTLEFVKQNCPKYDGIGNSNDLITWLRRIKPHVMYLQGNEPRRALEFLLVGDAREYYLSLETRPLSVLELGGVFSPKLDKDGTLRKQFQRSTSALSSNVQLTRQPPRPGTPETLEITNALSAPSSHAARLHRFHAQHERDYVLVRSVTSSPSDITLVSALHIDTAQCTDVDNTLPPGSNSWCSSVPLPPGLLPTPMDPISGCSPAASADEAVDVLLYPSNLVFENIHNSSARLRNSAEQNHSSGIERSTQTALPSPTQMVSSGAVAPVEAPDRSVTPYSSVALHSISSPDTSKRPSAISTFAFKLRSSQPLVAVTLAASLIWFTLTFGLSRVSLAGHNDFPTVLEPDGGRYLWHVLVP